MWLYACLLLCACAGLHAQDWQLVWQDEFDGDSIDLGKWDHEITAWGGGNGEFQVYTDDPENSYVRDGILYLKPTLLANNINPLTGQPFGEDFITSGVLDLNAMYGRCTNGENNGCYRQGSQQYYVPPIMSGRVRTAERFAYKFGRAEIRAKMPAGDWLWPAMWMLPEYWIYGGWPRSGEIDIIEIISNRDLTIQGAGNSIGCDHMGATLHWGPAWNENKYWLTTAGRNEPDFNYADHFHDFVFEWTENGMIWIVDDRELLRIPNPSIDQNPDWSGFWDFGSPWSPQHQNPWAGASNMAPFDDDFHFLLNVAVGATNGFIPDNVVNWGGQFPKPWNNNDGRAKENFYDARDDWLWTWEGENAAMQVDYVRVYQRV